MADVAKLAELNAEKDSLDPSFTHAGRLIDEEINKIKNPTTESNGNAKPIMEYAEKDLVDLFAPKMPKVECCIKVPTKEYPSVNFVGRIIGPGGSTLKGIQEVTRTRIAVLGKGSQRDKKKAEEMAESGDPKYAHMKLPLHVRISAVGPPDQAHMGVSRACAEVMKLIHVDEEELQQMNQSSNTPMQAGRGRGGQRGRGGNTPGRGMNPRGRGGTGQATPRGSARGAANSRGGRGGGSGRGGRGNARGGRGGQNNYQQKGQQQQMMQSADPYSQGGQDQYANYEGYGAEQYSGYEGYENYADGSYTDQSYGAEGYGADGSYGQEGGYDMSGQYGYGQQDGGYQSNYSYGNGAGDQGQYQQQQQSQQAPQQQQSKPFRGKMMGGRGQGGNNRGQRSANAKPY